MLSRVAAKAGSRLSHRVIMNSLRTMTTTKPEPESPYINVEVEKVCRLPFSRRPMFIGSDEYTSAVRDLSKLSNPHQKNESTFNRLFRNLIFATALFLLYDIYEIINSPGVLYINFVNQIILQCVTEATMAATEAGMLPNHRFGLDEHITGIEPEDMTEAIRKVVTKKNYKWLRHLSKAFDDVNSSINNKTGVYPSYGKTVSRLNLESKRFTTNTNLDKVNAADYVTLLSHASLIARTPVFTEMLEVVADLCSNNGSTNYDDIDESMVDQLPPLTALGKSASELLKSFLRLEDESKTFVKSSPSAQRMRDAGIDVDYLVMNHAQRWNPNITSESLANASSSTSFKHEESYLSPMTQHSDNSYDDDSHSGQFMSLDTQHLDRSL